MARMKILCDAERCIEREACVTACKNENEVPWGINRRRVVTINDGKPGERSISVACTKPKLFSGSRVGLPRKRLSKPPKLNTDFPNRSVSVGALKAVPTLPRSRVPVDGCT